MVRDFVAACVSINWAVSISPNHWTRSENTFKKPYPLELIHIHQICTNRFGKPLAARHCGSAAARWITAFIRHHGKTEETFSLARFDTVRCIAWNYCAFLYMCICTYMYQHFAYLRWYMCVYISFIYICIVLKFEYTQMYICLFFICMMRRQSRRGA